MATKTNFLPWGGMLILCACGSSGAPSDGAASGSGGATDQGTMGTGGSAQAAGGTQGGGGSSAMIPDTTSEVFGPVHSGSYNNGPVDYAETKFHNACAPAEKYPPQIRQLYGPYLAGVDNSLGGDGSLCDACALVTTRLGKKVSVHIVTYGISRAPGDLDLSPEAYDAIYESDPMGTPDVPRPMSWQLARCPEAGNMYLEYQTMANPYWTSFWVRNGRLPIAKVESKGAGEKAFSTLDRMSNGPFTDANGVGSGAFALRVTSAGGDAVTISQMGFTPGALVDSGAQFQ